MVIASVRWSGHQLYDQRLARGLAAAGRDVLYVEPAQAVGRPRRGVTSAPRRVDDGVRIVSPRTVPFGRRAVLGSATGAWVAWRAGREARRDGRPPATGVVVLGGHPLTARLLHKAPVLPVLLDDYVAGADLIGQPVARMRRHRAALVRTGPVTAVVSPVLADIVTGLGRRPIVVPAGCVVHADRPSEPVDLADIARPRAVFSGMVSRRIDLAAIEALACAGVAVVVVGGRARGLDATTVADVDAVLARPGVHVLGSRDEAGVRAVVAHCDVGLVPYGDTPFNRASFPLKVLEYLAEGVPVVSSDLPALQWLHCDDVTVVATVDAWPEAVRAAAADATPDARQRRRSFAAGHTWARRADTVLAALGATT